MNSKRASVCGPNRNSNQDFIDSFDIENMSFFLLLDGVGGQNGGEYASMHGAEVIKKYCIENFNKYDPRNLIINSITAANTAIYEKGNDRNYPEYYHMGSTLVLFAGIRDKYFFANIGDSSGYRLRDNKLIKMTRDDSLVQQLFDSGKITKEDMKTHPRKNEILKALGAEKNILPVLTEMEQIITGDLFMLCSDGVSDLINDDELELILSIETTDLNEKIKKIMTLVSERGFLDNSSICLIHCNNNS